MINPYEIGHYNGSNDHMVFYINSNEKILLISDDDQDYVYVYVNDHFSKVCTVMDYKYFDRMPIEISEGIRPATRSELKAAGLWDMVINKDDFSCKEDELEEYLRIAEEKEQK